MTKLSKEYFWFSLLAESTADGPGMPASRGDMSPGGYVDMAFCRSKPGWSAVLGEPPSSSRPSESIRRRSWSCVARLLPDGVSSSGSRGSSPSGSSGGSVARKSGSTDTAIRVVWPRRSASSLSSIDRSRASICWRKNSLGTATTTVLPCTANGRLPSSHARWLAGSCPSSRCHNGSKSRASANGRRSSAEAGSVASVVSPWSLTGPPGSGVLMERTRVAGSVRRERCSTTLSTGCAVPVGLLSTTASCLAMTKSGARETRSLWTARTWTGRYPQATRPIKASSTGCRRFDPPEPPRVP